MSTASAPTTTSSSKKKDELHEQLERDYVRDALDVLTDALSPYVEKNLQNVFGDKWQRNASSSFRRPREHSPGGSKPQQQEFVWDAHSTLTVMWDQWNAVFRQLLGHTERSLVSELREFRNRWAHQRQLNFDDTYRVLDSIERLLTAIGCDEDAERIYDTKQELLEREFSNKITERQLATQNRRNKWWTIGVYVVCCIAIVAQMIVSWSSSSYLVAGFVVLIFVYLIYQQFQAEVIVYGPRECRKCSRIIYTPECPYCQQRRSPKREKS